MTISYVQSFNPIWYIVGLDGLAAGGAQMFTYDSLNRNPKAIYEDAAGSEAYPNPFIFDLNGTGGPFYWKLDSTAPNDLYFVQIYDINGNLLEEFDQFPGTTGGGSDVTENIPLQNYITNNQFINHIAPTDNPITQTSIIVAPSNHQGFTPCNFAPLLGTYGVLGGDIQFTKNNLNATDQILFGIFSLSSFPMTNDVTPTEFIEYICTNAPSGEAYKCFQFPITQKVHNLANQKMTFTLWAKTNGPVVTLPIYSRQYYGSAPTATPESTSTRVHQGDCLLSSSWTKFIIQFTMPTTAGNSIGNFNFQTNDDAVYMQIGMPLGAICDVSFTKPCLFLGHINPDKEFDSYDEINSINSTPRCGDIKTSLLNAAPLGWLLMNDTTIGNSGSVATTNGDFTFQLYTTIYTAVEDTWAPVSGGRTSPGNTVAAAITDFLANKTLTLPRSLGRALSGAGMGAGLTNRQVGEYGGTESVTLALNQIPQHTHDPLSPATGFFENKGITGGNVVGTTGFLTSLGTTGGITGFTSQVATPIIQPTSYVNVFIKL